MEFDQPALPNPENSSSNGEQKEKRKKRKKRAPQHVPLHLDTEKTEQPKQKQEEKKPPTTERPKQDIEAKPETKSAEQHEHKPDMESPETAPLEAETHKVRPKKKSRRSKRRSEQGELNQPHIEEKPKAEAEAPKVQKETEPQPLEIAKEGEEKILPLEAEGAEGELFISDRWRNQEGAELTPPNPKTEHEPKEHDKPTPPSQTSRSVNPARKAATFAAPAAATAATTQRYGNINPANLASPLSPNIAPASTPNFAPRTNANFAPQAQSIERGFDRRSIVAGLIIGGLVEHVRHKRREKRRNKAHQQELKNVTKSNKDLQEHIKFAEEKAERRKTDLEMQIERLRKKTTQISSAERAPEQRIRPEQQKAAVQADKKPETAVKPIALSPEQQAEADNEIAKLPPDRRIETSAWHRIEVDKKTGKAVENPTIAYGEEFKREQHQEQLRKEIEAASMDTNTVKQRYTPFANPIKAHPDPTHALPAKASASVEHANDSAVDRIKDLTKDVVSRSEPIDIGLWVALIIIILAIIAAI